LGCDADGGGTGFPAAGLCPASVPQEGQTLVFSSICVPQFTQKAIINPPNLKLFDFFKVPSQFHCPAIPPFIRYLYSSSSIIIPGKTCLALLTYTGNKKVLPNSSGTLQVSFLKAALPL